MSIDMDVFARNVERLKQHIDSSRDLIGTDTADHILNRFGNAYVLDEYFNSTIRSMAVEILDNICEDLGDSRVVGVSCQAEAEGWRELRAIHRDWLALTQQANGLSGFSFTHARYMKSRRVLQRQH